jgi:uncharacterized flavoprotein (TIGR03862 family)
VSPLHSHPPQVAVVGGGPAGLIAAEVVSAAGAAVTVYDRMPSVGRKLLMAGRGGLNLTHGEEFPRFLTRYGPAAPRLRSAIEAFPPAAVRAWCEGLGQPTFVGSSGRVFPAAMKASPLLRAWLARLRRQGVRFALRHGWTGWDDGGRLRFAGPEGADITIEPDATILALGGASWPRLGSDGYFVEPLTDAGVAIAPLRPANCGFVAPWSDHFRRCFEGEPLKRIRLAFGDASARGEALITAAGVEGGAVYVLSALIREAIAAEGEATICVDLRPDVDADALVTRLSQPRGKQSLSSFLRSEARLAPVGVALMHEATLSGATALGALSPEELARLIKAVPTRLTGTAPLARAISTAGGVALDEVDETFMLRRRPGVFVAGEMLDWEAPTGGYLLQGCFATGAAAARGVLMRLDARGAAA